MNDLKLSQCCQKLYGRETSLNLLQSAFDKAQQDKKNLQVVFIGGPSGSGKSVLIQRAFENKNCFYAYSKYVKGPEPRPLSVLIHIITQICDAIRDSMDANMYKELLRKKATPEELAPIAMIVPQVANFVDINASDKPDLSTKQGLFRLKFSVGCFLRTVSLPERPVVFCVDDLQWACVTSIEIFDSIIADSELKHFIFAGCYRDNEVHDNEATTKWIDQLTEAEDNPTITKLQVGNLSVANISELLSELLKMDQHETKELAVLLESRSNGNAFHVMQLLDYLQADELLRKDLLTCRWTWNIANIKENTVLSDNAVQIVTGKMERLPPKLLHILKYAGCLGFRFNQNILALLCGINAVDVIANLNIAIEERLLERLDNDTLHFGHDKIFQAAENLIFDEGDRAQLHFDIGMILFRTFLSSREFHPAGIDIVGLDETILFLCAKQLSFGSSLIHDHNFRIRLCKINLEASKKAATFSAFIPAIQYLYEGIALLKKDGSNSWTHHYALTLELYSRLAEMLFASGQQKDDLIDVALNEVFRNAVSMNDSIRAYLIKVHVLSSQSMYKECITTALRALSQLGEKIPEKPTMMQHKIDFLQTKRAMQSTPDATFLSFPPIKDFRRQSILELIVLLWLPAFQSQNHRLVSMLSCRILQLTLKYGLGRSSGVGLALFALKICGKSRGDVDLSFRLSQLAVSISKKVGAFENLGMISAYATSIGHVRKPMSLLADDALDGYKIGMKFGNLNNAFMCATAYLMIYFYSGMPLAPLLEDLKRFVEQMKIYNQRNYLLMNTVVFQCVLNLTGNSNNPTDFSKGAAIELLPDDIDWENRSDGKDTECSYLMQVAFYCGDIRLASEMSKKLQPIDPGFSKIAPFYHTRVFFFALVAAWNAKHTATSVMQKQMYKLEAMKHLQMFQSWVKLRFINCVHKLQILEAEIRGIDPRCNVDKLHRLYNTAISASRRAGFLQDAALVNYLAGIRLRVVDGYLSDMYLCQSRKLYMLWGAKIAVDRIDMEFPDMMSKDNLDDLVSSSTGFRARKRFSKSIGESHKKLPIHLQSSSLSLSHHTSSFTLS